MEKFRKTEKLENSAIRNRSTIQSLFRSLSFSFKGRRERQKASTGIGDRVQARNPTTQVAAATEQTSSRSSSILSEVVALPRRHLEAIYLPFLSPSLF